MFAQIMSVITQPTSTAISQSALVISDASAFHNAAKLFNKNVQRITAALSTPIDSVICWWSVNSLHNFTKLKPEVIRYNLTLLQKFGLVQLHLHSALPGYVSKSILEVTQEDKPDFFDLLSQERKLESHKKVISARMIARMKFSEIKFNLTNRGSEKSSRTYKFKFHELIDTAEARDLQALLRVIGRSGTLSTINILGQNKEPLTYSKISSAMSASGMKINRKTLLALDNSTIFIDNQHGSIRLVTKSIMVVFGRPHTTYSLNYDEFYISFSHQGINTQTTKGIELLRLRKELSDKLANYPIVIKF